MVAEAMWWVGGGWVVGGWSDKTKLILISTLVEVVVEVEVELGNRVFLFLTICFGPPASPTFVKKSFLLIFFEMGLTSPLFGQCL